MGVCACVRACEEETVAWGRVFVCVDLCAPGGSEPTLSRPVGVSSGSDAPLAPPFAPAAAAPAAATSTASAMAEQRVFDAVAQLCSLPAKDIKAKLDGDRAVGKFCDDNACQTLYVSCSGGAVHASNTAPESKEEPDSVSVQFVKTKDEEDLSAENFAKVGWRWPVGAT